MSEDSFEGGGEEPRGWEDVGAALAFEEEGKPEGEVGAVRWAEVRCWALGGGMLVMRLRGDEEKGVCGGVDGGERTERRFRLSRRCRGTTVTISISQRKATSIGVRPACRGNAMIVGACVSLLKLELTSHAV